MIKEHSETIGCDFCSGGHAVIWAGDPHYKIPEGTPCACGLTKVHYKTCPICGHEAMEFVGE